MDAITIIIGIACFSYLIAEGSDLTDKIKEPILEKIPDNKITSVIKYIFNCNLCLGFWACLIVTGNPFHAIICGVLAELIGKLLSYEY